ncbi:MAG: hypothetical protein ACRBEQ_07605 [Hyphomonas sp.]
MSAKLLKWTGNTLAKKAAGTSVDEGEVPVAHAALADWMETQTRVMGFWLDRLIETDPESDLITMLHRQQSWMSLMHDRVSR